MQIPIIVLHFFSNYGKILFNNSNSPHFIENIISNEIRMELERISGSYLNLIVWLT